MLPFLAAGGFYSGVSRPSLKQKIWVRLPPLQQNNFMEEGTGRSYNTTAGTSHFTKPSDEFWEKNQPHELMPSHSITPSSDHLWSTPNKPQVADMSRSASWLASSSSLLRTRGTFFFLLSLENEAILVFQSWLNQCEEKKKNNCEQLHGQWLNVLKFVVQWKNNPSV